MICSALNALIASTGFGVSRTASLIKSLVMDRKVLLSLLAMLSRDLSLLVSLLRRFTVITSPSGLFVLPPVRVIAMELFDWAFTIVIAVGSRETASTISLNVSVSVSLLKSSSKSSSLGACMSSWNIVAGFALSDGTGKMLLPAISLAKLSLKDIQQLLISEHKALNFCISKTSS